MEAFDRANNLRCIEARALLTELHVPSQMPEELTPVEEVHDEVEFLFCLEGVMQIHDEGIFNLLQDLSLGYTRGQGN